jgi:hypothetical protein
MFKYGPARWLAPDPGSSEPMLKPLHRRPLSRHHLHATFKIQSSRKPHQKYDEYRQYQYHIHPHTIPFYIAFHFRLYEGYRVLTSEKSRSVRIRNYLFARDGEIEPISPIADQMSGAGALGRAHCPVTALCRYTRPLAVFFSRERKAAIVATIMHTSMKSHISR